MAAFATCSEAKRRRRMMAQKQYSPGSMTIRKLK